MKYSEERCTRSGISEIYIIDNEAQSDRLAYKIFTNKSIIEFYPEESFIEFK